MKHIETRSRPLVSVIVTTHDDRAHLLQAALASIYAQEGRGELFDLEVIVADNASSDPTPDVVRRFPGTRHLRFDTNRRLFPSLNAGVEAASGKYVAFLNDDDLWLPNKLKLQVPVLESAPELTVAYSQNIILFRNDITVEPGLDAPSGRIFRDLLMGNFIGAFAILVPRVAFERVGCFDESLSSHGDADMWLRLAFLFPFVFIPGPVALYLRSTEGVFSSDIAKGMAEKELSRVLERGLAMLAETGEDTSRLRGEAFAYADLHLATQLESMGLFEGMGVHLERALERFPPVAVHPAYGGQILRQVAVVALSSESPLETARALCERLKATTAHDGLSQRIRMRRKIARVWAEIAARLARSNGDRKAVATAARRALSLNPLQLRSKRLRRLVTGSR